MPMRRSPPSPRIVAAGAAIAAIGTALVLLLAGAGPAAAAPKLTGTDPAELPAGRAPESRTLVLFGSGLIAPGTTFRSLAADVKVSFDDGGGWRRARLVIPGRGWGAGELTATLPEAVAPPGGLKVKIAVNGEESNVHTIPVFTPLPPGPPRLVSVSPPVTAAGASPHHFDLEVIGDGHGGRLLFNGASPKDCLHLREGRTRDVYRFPVPEELRERPGSYPIQLENALGKSGVLRWDLVTKPELAGVAPASLRIAAAPPGRAQTVNVMATFSGSRPRSVFCRVDDAPGWEPVPSAIVFGDQVTFPLDLARLQPRNRVEIRVANAAGHSSLSIPVVRVARRGDRE